MFGHNFISSEGNAGFLRRKPQSPPKKKTDTYVREAQHERTYRPTPPIMSPHTNVCLEKKRQTRLHLTFTNTFLTGQLANKPIISIHHQSPHILIPNVTKRRIRMTRTMQNPHKGNRSTSPNFSRIVYFHISKTPTRNIARKTGQF